MHRADNAIEADIRREFGWNPILSDDRIAVSSLNGRVTLMGTVPTSFQTIVAREDAWSIAGVTAVDNRIVVALVGADGVFIDPETGEGD